MSSAWNVARNLPEESGEPEDKAIQVYVNSIKAEELRKLIRQLFDVIGTLKMCACIILPGQQNIYNRAALQALSIRLFDIFVSLGGGDIAYTRRKEETIINIMDSMGHAAVEFPNQVDSGYPPCSMQLFDIGTELAGFVYQVLEAHCVMKTVEMDDGCLHILRQHQRDIAAAYPHIMSSIDPSALIIVSEKADQPMAS